MCWSYLNFRFHTLSVFIHLSTPIIGEHIFQHDILCFMGDTFSLLKKVELIKICPLIFFSVYCSFLASSWTTNSSQVNGDIWTQDHYAVHASDAV